MHGKSELLKSGQEIKKNRGYLFETFFIFVGFYCSARNFWNRKLWNSYEGKCV